MSTAAVWDFAIEKGTTWEREIPVVDANGNPANLTGYSARMHIRTSPAAATTLLELSTANGRITITGASGLLTLKLTDVETAALAGEGGVYDLELVDAAGKVRRLLMGAATFSAEVTR